MMNIFGKTDTMKAKLNGYKYLGTAFKDGLPHRSYFVKKGIMACVYAYEESKKVLDIGEEFIEKEFNFDKGDLKKIKHPIKNLRVNETNAWYSKSADYIYIS